MSGDNPYLPVTAQITDIIEETEGPRAIRRVRVRLTDDDERKRFSHKPGQCAILSQFGKGESMISITSPPTLKGYLEFAVMRVGQVTTSIHELEVGDVIGLRGPYGNGFPVDEWKGKDLIFIGGGIGLAPLRSVYSYVLDKREDYGDVSIVYGARTSCDLTFLDELEELEERDDVDLRLCLDWKFGPDGKIPEEAEPGWRVIDTEEPECTLDALDEGPLCTRFTCFVPELVLVTSPSPDNAVALTCGPPIMIKFVVQNLEKLGFDPEQIYTTLEMRMKCGIGKCGRCNIGKTYVCVEGPVFTYKEIQEMPQEF